MSETTSNNKADTKTSTTKAKVEKEPCHLQTFVAIEADQAEPAPDELLSNLAGGISVSTPNSVLSREPSTVLQRHATTWNVAPVLRPVPVPAFAGKNFATVPSRTGNHTAIQTKLTVGAAHDPYEEEADQVAEQVMRMPAPDFAAPAGVGAPDDDGHSIQRTFEEEEELQAKPLASAITPLIQRIPAPPPEEKEPAESQVQRVAAEEDELQTKRGSAADSFEMGDDFAGRVAATRGGGAPLPDPVRTFMEPRFGADFSGVRVHAGSEAADLNQQVSAQAFTLGNDIYLGEGKTDLSSASGKQLLAHELTHVVQQGGAETLQTKPEEHVQRAVAVAVKLPPTSKPLPEEIEEDDYRFQDRQSAAVVDTASHNQPATLEASEDASPELAPEETTETAQAEAADPATGSEPANQTGSDNTEAASTSESPQTPEVGVKAELENAPQAAEFKTASKAVADKQAAFSDKFTQADKPKANLATGTKKLSDLASPETQGAVDALGAVSTELDAGAVERQDLVAQVTATLEDETKLGETERAAAEQESQKAGAELDQALTNLQELANPNIEFAAPGPAAPDQEPVIARMPADGAAEDEQVRTQRSAQVLNQFVGQNTGRSGTILGKAQTVQQSLVGTALQVKASLQASVQQNQDLVKQVIEGERQQVQNKATEVRGSLEGLFTTASDLLTTDFDAAKKLVEEEFQAKIDLLTTEEPTDLATVDQKVNDTIKSMQDVSALHKQIDAAQPDVDFWKGLTPGWADGDDYYDRKREAARNAAQGVRDAYKTEVTSKANDGAQQLANSTAKTDARKTVSDQYQQSRAAITTEKDTALTEIQQKYDTALTSITQVKAAKLDTLAQSLEATLTSLNDLETTLLTQLEQQGQSQGQATEATAQQVAAQIQQGATAAAGQLGPALSGLVDQARSIPAPDPDHLQEALAQAQAKLDAANAQLDATLGTQIGSAQQSLQQQGQQAVTGLTQAGAQAQIQATPISQAFSDNMDTLVQDTETTFTTTTTEHKTGVDTRAQTAVKQIGQLYTECHTGVTQILTALNDGLSQFATDFKSGPEGLDKSLANLTKDIQDEAKKAGDKVQPAWVKIVSFIGQILVAIVVAVAIGILVASGVGLVLGLIIAAAIGAAGGLAKGMLQNWAEGEDLMKDWGKNAALGAIEGMLMFAGGRFLAGGFAKSLLAKPGALMGEWVAKAILGGAVGTLRDVTMAAINMTSEGTFSWSRLGQTFVEALVINMASEFLFGGAQQAWKRLRPQSTGAPDIPAGGPDAPTKVPDADVPTKVPDTPTTTPDVPTSSKPLTPSAQAAKDLGFPDAPKGHEWVLSSKGTPYLRRVAGMGPTGENIPQIKYDPNSGGLVFADTGKPYMPPPQGFDWVPTSDGNPYLRPTGSSVPANTPEIKLTPDADLVNTPPPARKLPQIIQDFLNRPDVKQAVQKGLHSGEKRGVKEGVVKPVAYGVPVVWNDGLYDQYGPWEAVSDQRKTELKQDAQQNLLEFYDQLAKQGVADPNPSFDWNSFWADYQKQHAAP